MADRPMMPQHHRFVKALSAGLRLHCGVAAGSRVLAAVSGGADSVALARGLAALASRRGWELRLTIAHVQHHLRDEGGGAEGDAQFVRELAGELELPFVRADLDAPSITGSGNVEANARRARYAALAELAAQTHSVFVATAHHGDDQLETLLMRVMRGTSVRGLGAMPWRRRLDADRAVRLIRPLLELDRAAVVQFLNDLEQPWREDHTNADVTRVRARLRRDVLPVLHALRGDVARRAARLSQHLREVVHLLDHYVQDVASEIVYAVSDDAMEIDRIAARELSEVVLYELLRVVLLDAGARADKLGLNALGPVVRAIRDLKGGSRTFAMSGGVRVTVERKMVAVRGAGG